MERVIIVFVLTILATISAQLIIPKRPLGYVYGGGSTYALIHLDVHMGPLCPDSRDAFPVAKQVADHYGDKTLKLTLHMFPLPYHHQSFLTAKGAHIVKQLGAGDVTAYRWFKAIYANLDKLSNDATANMTTTSVITLLSEYARMLGVSPFLFTGAMKSNDIETITRAAWKYSCSRAIASTPTFLVNDITVAADPTWTLAEWRQVIDPLLEVEQKSEVKDCPGGEVKCEYLPGKTECCTEGEACIPNVGCRCFTDSCANAEEKPDSTELDQPDKPDSTELDQQNKPDSTELDQQDNADSTELDQQDNADSPELDQQDKPDSTELDQPDKPDSTELDQPDKTESLPIVTMD